MIFCAFNRGFPKSAPMRTVWGYTVKFNVILGTKFLYGAWVLVLIKNSCKSFNWFLAPRKFVRLSLKYYRGISSVVRLVTNSMCIAFVDIHTKMTIYPFIRGAFLNFEDFK